MKTLVYIIPGLGCEDASKPPAWVGELKRVLESASSKLLVRNASYTDGLLADRIAGEVADLKRECGDCRLVLIGHSFGAACIVWIQDHIRRMNLPAVIDLAILLDLVTDLPRHGFLEPLSPEVVLKAVRIYQTTDIIHSNSIGYSDSSRTVTNIHMREFGQADAKHTDVSDNPWVHLFISQSISEIP